MVNAGVNIKWSAPFSNIEFSFPSAQKFISHPRACEGVNLSLSSFSTGWSRESVLAEITGK